MAASRSSSPTGAIPGEANVNAAKELRSAMEAMAGIVGNLERSFNNQASAIRDMAKAMGSLGMGDIAAQVNQLGESFKQALAAIQQMSGQTTAALGGTTAAVQAAAAATQNLGGQIRDAGAAAANAGKPTQNLGNILGDVSEETQSLDQKLKKVGKYLKKEYPVAVGAALGAMSGLAQGFRNIVAVGKAVFGVFESLIGFAYELGVSLIQIPFKIFDGLLSMARKGGGGSELATAIEKVRENFGHLTNQTPKAIFATARSLDKLNFGGISAYRIFGNLAQRIEKINTLFMTGGPAIRNLTDEFIKSGPIILGYQKGLGLSDEMMGSIAQQAQSMGKPMTKILNDITKQSLHLGEAFKLDAKIISREMGKAAMDMKHFGDVSIKQIGVAVTYAHKLGIDLEKVTGIMDSFSTFDSAAENVSKLNEAFGTNISAMEMLQAESPDQQLEILRKEMARVGVDGEKLNRHYRSLITQTTSLDDATIKAAFSSKNQGISLKEIQKQSEKAEKKTMSQTEAMNKLSGAMERIVESGSLSDKGFFGQFFQGIEDGIMRTAEFRKIMMNIAAALRVVYQEGLRLGGQIVQLFPGLKEFLGGLGDLFSPAKFQKLARGVSDVIIEWMKGLTDPSKKFSFGVLMDKIQEKFFDFFNMETSAGRKTVSGFTKILDVISIALGEFVRWAAEKLTQFFKFAADFIQNPTAFINVSGAESGVMAFIGPLISAISDSWPALWEAFKNLMSVAFTKLFEWVKTGLWPIIEPYMSYVYTGLALILFGPAVGQALLGAFTGMMMLVFTKGLPIAVNKFAAAGQSGALGGLGKKIADILKPPPAAAAAAAGADAPSPSKTVAGALPDDKERKKLENPPGKINWPAILTFVIGLALVLTVGMVALFVAVGVIRTYEVTNEELMMAIASLIAIGFVALQIALTMKLIEKAKIEPTSALIGFAAIAIVMIAFAAVAAAVSWFGESVSIVSFMAGITMLAVTGFAVLGFGLTLVALAAIGSLAAGPVGLAALAGFGAVVLIVAGLGVVAKTIVDIVRDNKINIEEVRVASSVISLASEAIGVAVKAMFAALVGSVFKGISRIISFFGGGDPFKDLVTIVTKLIGKDSVVENLIGISRTLSSDTIVKVDAIVKIMVGVTEMLKTIAEVIGKVAWANLISSFSNAEEPVKSVLTLTKELFGNKENGSGIVGLISKVNEIVATIGANSQTIQAAGAIASIISGVAEVAKALTPPDGFSKALEQAVATWGEDANDLMKNLTAHTGKLGEILLGDKGLIASVTKIINADGLKNITEANAKGLEAVASLMTALGPLANALTPPAATMDMLKQVASTWGENTTRTLKALGSYAQRISGVLVGSKDKGGKKGLIESVMDAIGGLIKSLNQNPVGESQIKFMTAFGPILKTMFELFSNLLGIAPLAAKMKPEEMKQFAEILEKIRGVVATFFASLSLALPKIIEGVLGAMKSIEGMDEKKLESNVKKLKSIFSIISEVTSTYGSLINVGGTSVAFGPAQAENLFNAISNVENFLWTLAIDFSYNGFYGNGSLLSSIVGIINSESVRQAGSATAGISSLKSIFELINSVVETATTLLKYGDKGFDNTAAIAAAGMFKRIAIFFLSLVLPSDALPLGIMGSIATVASAFSGAGGSQIKAGVDVFKNILDNLSQIVTLMQGMTKTFLGKELAFDHKVHVQSMQNIASFFSESKDPILKIGSTVKEMQSLAINADLFKSVKQTIAGVADVSAEIQRITTITEISKKSKVVGEIKTFFEESFTKEDLTPMRTSIANANSMLSGFIIPALQAITKINEEAKKLSDKLTRGAWSTELPIALKQFAQKGATNLVGAAGKYTIGSSPVVINITLAVAMDAKQIETAVIMRKDSYIRDRVHYLLQLAAGSDAIKVDELIKKGTASTTELTEFANKGQIPIEGTDPGYAAKENQTDKK